jgi:hypothetical protein
MSHSIIQRISQRTRRVYGKREAIYERIIRHYQGLSSSMAQRPMTE